MNLFDLVDRKEVDDDAKIKGWLRLNKLATCRWKWGSLGKSKLLTNITT